MILRGESLGRIEFDILFEYITDNDGDFVRCVVYSIPSYDYVVGDWMRDRNKAFKNAMMLVLNDKKVLNTIH